MEYKIMIHPKIFEHSLNYFNLHTYPSSVIRPATICLFLLLPLVFLHGQELYFYGVNSRPLDSEQQALTLKEVRKTAQDHYTIITKHLAKDGWERGIRQKIRVRSENSLVIRESGPDRFFPRKIFREMGLTASGAFTFRDSDGNGVIREGTSSRFLPIHLEGKLTEYYPGGQIKSISQYRDNQLITNENWLSDGTRYTDNLFYSVDRLPEFEYGVQFFNSYLMQKLSNSGIDLSQIDDRVVIGWVIMETGAIDSPIALEGNSTQLKRILTDIIAALPGVWKPATLNGKPVRYFVTLPLNFFHRDVSFQNIETSSGVLIYDKF
ncbi:MAG: hypothetical protein V2B15_01090 [Bacteroidota bacterium]